MRSARLVACVLVVGVLAACDRPDGRRAGTTTSTSAVADAVALDVADLPKGFEADDPDPAPDPAEAAACAGLAGDGGAPSASSAFARGDLQRVVASAHRFESDDAARAAVDDLAGDPGQSCVRALLALKGEPAFEVIEAFDLGDGATAVRVTLPTGDRGLAVTADVVSMRIGRIVATVAFIGAGAPLPSPDVHDTMTRWRTRLTGSG